MNAKRSVPVVSLLALFFLLLSAGLTTAEAGVPKQAEDMLTADTQRIRTTMVEVPFIKNQGQADKKVAFFARTFGGTVFITVDGRIVYSLPQGAGSSIRRGVAIYETLAGSSTTDVKEADSVGAKVNFYKGNDRSKWRMTVPAFQSVSLGEVYPGIEARVRAYGNNAEKIFTVHPGADPSRIIVRVEGARDITVGGTGELLLATGKGTVSFSKPVAYQIVDGKRKAVTVAYAVKDDTYSFELGAYDRERALVIDPLLSSTFIGGSLDDFAQAVTVDRTGNVYVTGTTSSMDFPTIPGDFDTTWAGGYDVFISRLNGNLTSLVASTYLGGSLDEQANAVAVDQTGNVYVTGRTNSSNFPTTADAYERTYAGGNDAFVSKLNGALDTLLSSTYLGGGSDDEAMGLALDGTSVVIAGVTSSLDFPTSQGSLQMEYKNGEEAFVSKLSGDLGILIASTYLGGSMNERGTALAVGEGGVIYLSGWTQSSDLEVTDGAFDMTYNDGYDVFISKMSGNLSSLLALTYLGGGLDDFGLAIVRDATTGNLYVAGFTNSSNFPTTAGAYGPAYIGGNDVFISVISEDLGGSLVASTYVGGSQGEVARAISLDSFGNVFVSGQTMSNDFPATVGAYDSTYRGNGDGFVANLSGDLRELHAGTYLGGSQADIIWGATVDGGGNLYVVGNTTSPNFPVTKDVFDIKYNTSVDAFVTLLSADLNAASCSFTLSPTSQTFPAEGGSGTVSVTASAASCTWSALSNSTFATITAGEEGTGSGIIDYTVDTNSGGDRTGSITIAGRVFTITQGGSATTDVVPVYRFYNTVAGGHFFTVVANERDIVLQTLPQYRYEGIGFYAFPATGGPVDTVPVYRFYNTVAGGHFFTVVANERDIVLQTLPQYRYEGIGFYAFPATGGPVDAVPAYRFYNTVAGGHFFTVVANERDIVLQTLPQYRYEGIGFYAFPAE